MKRFRVKVTEIHSDYVWITANSAEEAEKNIKDAHAFSDCEYEALHDVKATGEWEEV